MNAVTIVGLIAGAALIATAIYVFVSTRQFALGGVGITLIGLVLIGMSQWTHIKIKGGGVDIDLRALQEQIATTASAVDAVAAEAVTTAEVAGQTRDQVVTIANQLERRQVLSTLMVSALRDSLSSIPQIDTNAVNAARASIQDVVRQ